MQDDDELLTVGELCKLYGGVIRPIHPATLYRGINAGRFAPLVHPSPGISRGSKRQALEALARIIAEGK